MAPEPARLALELHRRLLDGDPTASAEIAEMMLPPLKAHLHKRHSAKLDHEALDDVAVDAVIAYLKAPEKFDPSKAGLFRYLTLIAEGDLKDTIRYRSRRPHNFVDSVEISEHSANRENDDAESRAGAMAILDRYGTEICTDPGDEVVLALMLRGEKGSESFARALGLRPLDSPNSRRTVTQVKDKIKKRLRRLGERLLNDQN